MHRADKPPRTRAAGRIDVGTSADPPGSDAPRPAIISASPASGRDGAILGS